MKKFSRHLLRLLSAGFMITGAVFLPYLSIAQSTIEYTLLITAIIGQLLMVQTAGNNTSIAITNTKLWRGGLSVGFYSNGVLLGTLTNAPSSFTWTNAPQGTNVINYVVYDRNGVAVASSSVTSYVMTGVGRMANGGAAGGQVRASP